MEKRLRKIVRVLSVQEKLQQIAEWKLASLQRQASVLQEAQETLIRTLNDSEALHGLFVEPRARRLQVLAVEENQVQEAQETQSRLAVERAMQVKRTERMVSALSIECRRAAEKKAYLALLDSFTTKRDASLP